jgi:anti-sigma factor RsiW
MVCFHSESPRLFCKADRLRISQAQTPAQKRANARFAKAEEDKRGKPVAKKRDTEKSPIPRWVIGTSLVSQVEYMRILLTGMIFTGILAFVVCGSLIFELVRLLFPPKAPTEYTS